MGLLHGFDLTRRLKYFFVAEHFFDAIKVFFIYSCFNGKVTVEYSVQGGAMVPKRVHTIVISTQHSPDIENDQMKKLLREMIVKAVIPAHLLDSDTVYHLQPSGRFIIGGPQGDAGLTGRKIIVDTYGGWGAHGGGAFSGKDWSKVDRSAAYAARWVAKSLVSAGLARRCLVQVCGELLGGD